MKKKLLKRNAFTLIEVVVVIVILVMLASIATPLYFRLGSLPLLQHLSGHHVAHQSSIMVERHNRLIKPHMTAVDVEPALSSHRVKGPPVVPLAAPASFFVLADQTAEISPPLRVSGHMFSLQIIDVDQDAGYGVELF